MEILDYLPLDELLLSARLVNRKWNTRAVDIARLGFASWASNLRHAVCGNVEIVSRPDRTDVERALELHICYKDTDVNILISGTPLRPKFGTPPAVILYGMFQQIFFRLS
jgi:hypothetical protein